MKKNHSGQSLVSVIIAGGVGAVVLGFLTETMIQQGMGQKFLTQKLEINDLTNNLITTFSKGDNCTCQFADDSTTNPNHANYASQLKFDTTLPIDQRKISVKKLYTGCKSAAFTPPVLVEDDAFVPNSSSGIKVDTVELIGLHQVGANPNDWQGQWQISFQTGTGKVIRSVRPISVTQKVTINTAPPNSPTAAVISACTGISTGNGTENYLAKWSGTLGVLQNSAIFESSGNVGIGTLSPQGDLHISGRDKNVVASVLMNEGGPASVYTAQNIYHYSNVGLGGINMYRSRGTLSSKLPVQAGDALGAWVSWGWDGSTWGSQGGANAPVGIGMHAAQNFTPTNTPTFMTFVTSNGSLISGNTGQERMRIDKDGNVGIGTSNPTSLLDAKSNTAAGSGGTVMLSKVLPIDGTEDLISFVLRGLRADNSSDWQWHLYTADPDGGVGVSPRAFELWEYPIGATGTYCCRRRIVVESSYGYYANMGDIPPPNLILDRSGNITVGGTIVSNGSVFSGQGYASLSDRRLKKNIFGLSQNTLAQVLKLRPVSFQWKKPFGDSMSGGQIGFIAQDVHEIFPDAVITQDSEEKILGIKYNELFVFLTKAVQEFYAKWFSDSRDLHRAISFLKKENSELKARLEKIERQLEQGNCLR